MMKNLRVLLVSPLDPDVPGDSRFLMGGENTYTRTLLSYPPRTVTYIHHTQALKQGVIKFGPWQKILGLLTKARILPLSAGVMDLVVEGDFDLVHCHAYPLRISGKNLPVVLSDSSANLFTLHEYFGWSPQRIKTAYLVRRLLFEKLGVFDQDLFLGNFSKLIVFSQFAKRLHLDFGGNEKRIEVIYPGLPTPKIQDSRFKIQDSTVTILFIGVWFERKGGAILWEAYKKLEESLRRRTKLVLIGLVPDYIKKAINTTYYNNVEYRKFLPREILLKKFYPKADILVLVPPSAEGYGFVVQEAASFGIPAVVSRVCALPELVLEGETGFIIEPDSVESLAAALERLINDNNLRKEMGRNARKYFLKKFTARVMGEKLRRVYEEAL